MIEVKDIWAFFLAHQKEMQEKYICVAEFPSQNTEVYLTNEYGYAYFTVDVNGVTEYDEYAIDKHDIESVYQGVLDKAAPEEEELYDEALDQSDINRLNEIYDAVEIMLEILMESPAKEAGFDTQEIHKLTEQIEDLLAQNYGALVRHPTATVNEETGLIEVIQFPYE